MDSWRSVSGDLYVLHLLQRGLRLIIVYQPRLTTSPMPFALPEASSKGEHLQTEIVSMLERRAIERVANAFLPRFYSLLLVFPKRMGTSLGDLSAVIQLSPSEGEVSCGDACKSWALQSKGRLGSLCGSDGCLLSCRIHPLPRTFPRVLYQDDWSIPVSVSAFWPVGKPEIHHSRSGCHDGPCSFLGPADPPLLRHLAPVDPASEVSQVTNPASSALNYPPGFVSQSGEIRVNTNSGLSLHLHTLPKRSGAVFPREVCFKEAACHARGAIQARYVTAQDFFSLLGRLVFFSDLVSLGRLRHRLLQLYLLAHWCSSQGQLLDRIALDQPFLITFLYSWTKPSNVL